jgi:hypothetical protein
VDPTFEVIRFQVAPAGGAVAVIELEGRPADPGALSGRPVLLLEGPVEHAELRAIVEPDGADDGVLRASFAAPLELAVDSATTYALAIGRGPLLELPAPDGAGEAGLEVRLARTVNRLRAELHDARSRLGTEVGEARERLAEQDERAARELAAEREGAAAARAEAERAAAAERDKAAAEAAERERLASELDDARAELASVRTERDAARAELSGLRAELADAREEADELRDALDDTRSRIGELETAVSVPRTPRVPRRPPRVAVEEQTARHQHIARTDHSSLGRGVARALVVILVALLVAALIVLVLQVRVV